MSTAPTQRRSWRLRLVVTATLATAFVLPAVFVPAVAHADDGEDSLITNKQAQTKLAEIDKEIALAASVAKKDTRKSENELAERLVEGKLRLAKTDYEGAAIMFLDLLENDSGTWAASQALYFLGESLLGMEMFDWAGECFVGNLSNTTPNAKLHHQRSIARLLDLSVPPRDKGFSRRPGLSATPEVRARLIALGESLERKPREGLIDPLLTSEAKKLAEAIPAESRIPELHYAYGRFLYLTGKTEKARAELDMIAPPDKPVENTDLGLQAAYVAAAATLALGETDGALARFESISTVRADTIRGRQITDLARLAIGRIHHDADEPEKAVAAYKLVSRDSPYFGEAMYETAWTLLRNDNHKRAIQALDTLVVYDPDSPILAEVKQLRGKVKIQERDWEGAEEDFEALRMEFDRLAKGLERQAKAHENASDYFAALVRDNMRHFSLSILLPPKAVRLGRQLPRAAQSEALAQEMGEIEADLTETRELLSRMEDAVAAPERARLFDDLGSHASALDLAARELVGLKEKLLKRATRKLKGQGLLDLEAKRKQMKARIDEPPAGEKNQAETGRKIASLRKQVSEYDLAIQALRAELVAGENYYNATLEQRTGNHDKFLAQATEAREEIAAMEKDRGAVEAEIERLQTRLRFYDPWAQKRRKRTAEYSDFLDEMYGQTKTAKVDREVDDLWQQTRVKETDVDDTREMLDKAAGRRLERAVIILKEERVNLDKYLIEATALSDETGELVGDVMQASYKDVLSEVQNLVTRSEVGILDIAWAIKESETEEVRRLEGQRNRDVSEIDRILEQGLEELE